MAAPTGPKRLAAYDNTPYLDMIAFNTAASGDIDFTNTSGPTAGICPRGIYATGNGAITFYAVGAAGDEPAVASRTVTVGDKTFLPVAVASVDNTNTNATGLFACL